MPKCSELVRLRHRREKSGSPEKGDNALCKVIHVQKNVASVIKLVHRNRVDNSMVTAGISERQTSRSNTSFLMINDLRSTAIEWQFFH
jgi:precorrin isomerase